MSRAKRIIKLSEQEKEQKVEAPDLSNVLDGWVTHWSGDHVEYESPTVEDGVLQVFNFGSWHWKVRGEIVGSGDTFQSLAAFLKDNMGVTIQKKTEDEPTESLKNKKIKEQTKTKQGDDIYYDDSQMKEVVDNFVRFLIGDQKVALRKLNLISNPKVQILNRGSDEYNQIYDNLYNAFMSAIKKELK